MRKSFAILLICVLGCDCLYAQQPPAQLPSLPEDNYTQTPELHANENPEALIRKSIYVTAVASNKVVYTGEPILVTYKLYSCIFSRSRVSKQPDFNGCSVMELASAVEPEIEIINGKTFHVYTVRKVQVIPLEEGPLQLGNLAIDNVVQISRDGRTLENFSVTTSNEPLIIQVKPLPGEGKPANFSGVVGSFIISASLDSNSVPVGENATLRITIKGNGNFAGIHIPSIPWPRGAEHFDVSDTQHIDQDAYPVTGYKTFSIPFIGSKVGRAEIGPVSFNFYDPLLKLYRTITADKLAVTFTKALTRNDRAQEIVQEDVGNSKYLWIVAAIAAVVIISWLIGIQLKSSKQPMPVKEKTAVIKQATVAEEKDYGTEILSALNRLGNVEDDKRFLSAASYLLTASLQFKLSAPDATTDELMGVLKQQESFELANMCNIIFTDCNRNLYSPDAKEGVKEKVYFELSAVIKKLYPVS